jgi:hypothetical protein
MQELPDLSAELGEIAVLLAGKILHNIYRITIVSYDDITRACLSFPVVMKVSAPGRQDGTPS